MAKRGQSDYFGQIYFFKRRAPGRKNTKQKRKKEIFKWLLALEYNFFKIPEPNIIFFLKTSPELSLKLSARITDKEKRKKKRTYLGSKKRDIHEKDKRYLSAALFSYLQLGRELREKFKVIECINKGNLLLPEEINEKVFSLVVKFI